MRFNHHAAESSASNAGRKKTSGVRYGQKARPHGNRSRTTTFHKFLELPAEMREKIYIYHFDRNLEPFLLPKHAIALLFTCKLVHQEAEPVLHKCLTDGGVRRFSLAVTGVTDGSVELKRPTKGDNHASKSFLHGGRGLHTMQFVRFVDIVFVSDQQKSFQRFSTHSQIFKNYTAFLSSMPLLIALDVWWPAGQVHNIGRTPPRHAMDLLHVALNANTRLVACGMFSYPRILSALVDFEDLAATAMGSATGWEEVHTDRMSLEFRRLKV